MANAASTSQVQPHGAIQIRLLLIYHWNNRTFHCHSSFVQNQMALGNLDKEWSCLARM